MAIRRADKDDDPAAGNRGLRAARWFGFLGVLAVILLLTLPPGAPLRDPQTARSIGNSPFMDSLLFIIMLFFLVAGIAYGGRPGRSRAAPT